MFGEVIDVIGVTLWMIAGIAVIFGIYLVISALCWFVYTLITKGRERRKGFNALKTVTFGDESAVVANRVASVASVVAIFVLWALATGSSLLPFSLPTAFNGLTSFTYTAENAAGETDDGVISMRVVELGAPAEVPEIGAEGNDGFAKNFAISTPERRSKIVATAQVAAEGTEGFKIVAINGERVVNGDLVPFADGQVFITQRGSMSVRPSNGVTMEALYLPPPEQVWSRLGQLLTEGYQGIGFFENLAWSLIRVFVGFGLGCLFGIPLGFAIGLNSWLRGWFDPLVEFMRPVPPLALIPLVIIWFGIGEQGKISLLFLAALWIMAIAARAGVSGVQISKVHAAYSLGASKRQLLQKVILPNSLPEIFTGARVAMGVISPPIY